MIALWWPRGAARFVGVRAGRFEGPFVLVGFGRILSVLIRGRVAEWLIL